MGRPCSLAFVLMLITAACSEVGAPEVQAPAEEDADEGDVGTIAADVQQQPFDFTTLPIEGQINAAELHEALVDGTVPLVAIDHNGPDIAADVIVSAHANGSDRFAPPGR